MVGLESGALSLAGWALASAARVVFAAPWGREELLIISYFNPGCNSGRLSGPVHRILHCLPVCLEGGFAPLAGIAGARAEHRRAPRHASVFAETEIAKKFNFWLVVDGEIATLVHIGRPDSTHSTRTALVPNSCQTSWQPCQRGHAHHTAQMAHLDTIFLFKSVRNLIKIVIAFHRIVRALV